MVPVRLKGMDMSGRVGNKPGTSTAVINSALINE